MLEQVSTLKSLLSEQYTLKYLKPFCSESIEDYAVSWEDKMAEMLRVSDPKTGYPLFHASVGTLYFYEDKIVFNYYTRLPHHEPIEQEFSYSEIFELSKFIEEAKEKLLNTANQG